MRIKTFIILLLAMAFHTAKAQNEYAVDLNIKTEPTKNTTVNETKMGLNYNKSWHSNSIKNVLSYSNTSINYQLESYDLHNTNNHFISIENVFTFSRPINKVFKWNLTLHPTLNFQNTVTFSSFNLLGQLSLEYSMNTTKINLGVMRSTVFGSSEILPYVSLFYQINKQTAAEIGFPNSRIVYANSSRNSFSISNDFAGTFYKLDHTTSLDQNNTAYRVRFSQMTTALEYQRNMDKNWYVSLKTGYVFNKNYQKTTNTNTTVLDYNLKNGPTFSVGLQYKH